MSDIRSSSLKLVLVCICNCRLNKMKPLNSSLPLVFITFFKSDYARSQNIVLTRLLEIKI